ncbi:MAG: hypothetical protein IPP15_16030 [Saprospiraceae bacterium]|uniref:Uncharacterized protein n=1 Tax=Candidatus Opimibacter skivensis TaxID=2982028 RepID=A0A9D7SX52_9BACT|nr:hypothetical protein [Candidatus Opimibacter skivensis]
MELTGDLLGKIESDAISAVDGDLEGILEAVRRNMFPNSGAPLPKDVKEIALAVGRQSSRSGAQAAARAAALLMKSRTVGVETRTQTVNVIFDISTGPGGAPLPNNVIISQDVTPLDTTYDLITGMFVVIKTPDPVFPQVPAGAIFSPEIGLQCNQGIIKELAPRELYMVDRNGTTPVDSRFTRLELETKIVGNNLKLMSRFFTPPGFTFAVNNTLANQYYSYSITFELSRTKRRLGL